MNAITPPLLRQARGGLRRIDVARWALLRHARSGLRRIDMARHYVARWAF
ncbi:MAG TPA: hypothetical protein VFN94_07690 [Nitrospiria bacterium]|nr:hypothetical protein [Nitrospiria bacterium]